MPQTIQIKRGLKAHLPTLLAGEMAFCTDTKEIYVGDGTNNTVVGRVMTGTEATRANSSSEKVYPVFVPVVLCYIRNEYRVPVFRHWLSLGKN